MASQKRSSLLQFLLLFAVVYLLSDVAMQYLFPKASPEEKAGSVLTSQSRAFTRGHHPVLLLENKPVSVQSHGIGGWVSFRLCQAGRIFTGGPSPADCRSRYRTATGPALTVADRCPRPPVDLFKIQPSGSGTGETLVPLSSPENAIPCEAVPAIEPGETVQISLAPWKYSIFGEDAVYEARVPGTSVTARFAMAEPGIITKLFRTFVTSPFLNLLIFIASFVPGHDLALAIILFTIIVKLLLFLPTQHAMEGQKKLQLLQPKFEEIKKRFPNDAKRQQEETMKLWKEYKINPFSACLPTLLQFPILIGIFYVIRDGSVLELSRHLIYPFYQDLAWHFDTDFLWMDLLRPEVFVLPVALVVLQFLQMKLAFAITERKKAREDAKKDVIDVGAKPKAKEPASPQQMQQKMMLYVLPLLIGVFAFQFPSAVSLYWGVSTLFAIGQQMYVNREHLRV